MRDQSLFVKELSFPKTTPTDDAFFQPDWAGAYWGSRAGDCAAAGLVCRLRIWHRWFAVSECGTSLQRQERERADGASPVAAPMPKSVSF